MRLSNIMNNFVLMYCFSLFFSLMSMGVVADSKNRDMCQEYVNIDQQAQDSLTKKFIKCDYGVDGSVVYSVTVSLIEEYCSYVLQRIEGDIGSEFYYSFFSSVDGKCENEKNRKVRFYTGQSEMEAYKLLRIVTNFLNELDGNNNRYSFSKINLYERFSYDFKDFFMDFDQMDSLEKAGALISVEKDKDNGSGFVLNLELKERIWSVFFHIKNGNVDCYKVVSRI